MGTPHFAVPALNALADAGHEVVAVYTQPPRPAGRGTRTRPSPVQTRAQELGLIVRCPADFRSAPDVAAFRQLDAEVAVVVAYGLILPPQLLDAPVWGCLNIHASLLPRWRGAAPIQRAIMAGDPETGISVMQMEAGLDTGPVLLERRLPITEKDTAETLHDRLAALGAATITTALAQGHRLSGIDQASDGVTYAAKIAKAEARLDWSAPAIDIDRKIRGLSPFPGAWCLLGDERLKLLDSRIADGAGSPGEVLDSDLTIACGSGAVRVLRVQRAGKAPMDAATFLRGAMLTRGTQLT